MVALPGLALDFSSAELCCSPGANIRPRKGVIIFVGLIGSISDGRKGDMKEPQMFLGQ